MFFNSRDSIAEMQSSNSLSTSSSVTSPFLKKSKRTSISSTLEFTASYSITHFFSVLIFFKLSSAFSGSFQNPDSSVFFVSVSIKILLESMSKKPPQGISPFYRVF